MFGGAGARPRPPDRRGEVPELFGSLAGLSRFDELEDTAFDIDEWKGTLVFKPEPTRLPCPVCSQWMKRFNYRLFGLELEFCDQLHGYWLDKGEEGRILELMSKTEADALRKLNAEDRFARFRKNLRSPHL